MVFSSPWPRVEVNVFDQNVSVVCQHRWTIFICRIIVSVSINTRSRGDNLQFVAWVILNISSKEPLDQERESFLKDRSTFYFIQNKVNQSYNFVQDEMIIPGILIIPNWHILTFFTENFNLNMYLVTVHIRHIILECTDSLPIRIRLFNMSSM